MNKFNKKDFFFLPGPITGSYVVKIRVGYQMNN